MHIVKAKRISARVVIKAIYKRTLMKDIQRNAPIMLGLGIWYPVYRDRARIRTPERACAGASALNRAANIRKNALKDTATVKTNNRNILRVEK
jgi:hypothetical protein